MTTVPSERRLAAPAPLATTRGSTPSTKENEVIRIGRKRRREASVGGFEDAESLCALLARELDDQDGVLARERDEQNDADLHVDVVRVAARGDGDDRSEQAERNGEDHRRRCRPALVLRGQHEKDQHDREAKIIIVSPPTCFSW